MSEQHDDRRAHLRYRIPTPITLHLLFPEETFSAREHTAVASDISRGGCRLRVNGIDRMEYVKLLNPLRYSKVFFHFKPGSKVEVRGRIVWLDFHDATNVDICYCQLGIAFENVSQEFISQLEEKIRLLTM